MTAGIVLDVPHGVPASGESGLKTVVAQFEAVLLEMLVGGLQKTFSSLGDKNDLGVGSTYDYLGTQALASAWAQAGGIGLGRAISDKLLLQKGL